MAISAGYIRRLAALFHGLAKGHGFTDGNKRTALILTHVLLDESGYTLEPKDASEALDEREIEQFAISVADGTRFFEDTVAWFKARIRKARP
jgi:death-on-curing protein